MDNSGEYNILYKSTDRAGNVEGEKEQKIKIDKISPVINILIPLETQEFMRDEFMMPEYEINDNYSGVASDSLAVLMDGRPIGQEQQDLFYYSLGEHVLKIAISDFAGNQAEASVIFTVGANSDSAISDVNRSYDLGWINSETVKSWLVKELARIKKFKEDFGVRLDELEQKWENIISQCLEKKDQAWCEEKLEKYHENVYRLDQINKEITATRYQKMLIKLEVYYLNQWLNQLAYDIIKADINYLINNL